jgi:hypothetical protein
MTHPTGISAGNGGKAGVQAGSKPAINKQAKAANKYIGFISHSRCNFISSTADTYPHYITSKSMPWRLVFTDCTNQCKILW